ncbi:MAG: signal peptidase I [Acutalibacteraceae bacterium]|nr:signal peptidase I [Acutalibacteraceae bacterium]
MKKTPKHAKKKFSKKTVFRYIIFSFIGIVLGLFVYAQNAQGILRDKMPMPFGYGMSVVLSGSMESRLSVDDLVIIKATDRFEVNDIVLYQDGDSLVIHRIIEIDGDTVTTKGDANNVADEPINKSQIKGVLVYDITGLGAVVNVLKQPVSVFIILAAALLLTELSYRKEKDKDTEELDEIKKMIEELKKDKNA